MRGACHIGVDGETVAGILVTELGGEDECSETASLYGLEQGHDLTHWHACGCLLPRKDEQSSCGEALYPLSQGHLVARDRCGDGLLGSLQGLTVDKDRGLTQAKAQRLLQAVRDDAGDLGT